MLSAVARSRFLPPRWAWCSSSRPRNASETAGASRHSRQQPPPPPQPAADPNQPVFRTGINFVRVDAIVTDRQGNPVSDLKQTDFEVFEDNKPQAVETFRLVKIDTIAPAYTQRSIRSRDDEETAASDENARIFVFFLDDYHVRLGTSMAVRRPLVEFIANQLSPNDLIAVMYPLTPVDAVVLTRNHQGVINTVEKFVGRKFDYEPKNDIEAAYVYKYPTDVVETIRRQVSMSALRGISQKLGSLREGRKSIILVSEGYTALLPPQMRNAIAGMPGIVDNPARRDPFAGDNNMLEDRARFSADVDMLQELQDVFDAANRNNTSIYAVDPRGLSTGEFDISENISMTTSQSYSQLVDGHPAHAGREHRRSGDRQSQRPGGGHEADHPRLERLLPARLQLDAGAAGRQVPRNQSAREAVGRSGPRAQGLLGDVCRSTSNAPSGASQGGPSAGRQQGAGIDRTGWRTSLDARLDRHQPAAPTG